MLLVRLHVVEAIERAQFLFDKGERGDLRMRARRCAPVRHGQRSLVDFNDLEIFVRSRVVVIAAMPAATGARPIDFLRTAAFLDGD